MRPAMLHFPFAEPFSASLLEAAAETISTPLTFSTIRERKACGRVAAG